MELASALELGERELVAFVGAGGKKTAMAHLAETGREREIRAGYTTTVHMPPPTNIPLVVDSAPSEGVLTGREAVAFATERVPNPERASEKVRGYDPAVLDGLFADGGFDWLLVKADGARRREFKAPGPNEPVIPSRATKVAPVASARAIGEPLAEETVHRPERVAAISETALGETVTAATVGKVLASEGGGLKGVPPGATVTPLVNKCDADAAAEQGREALRVAFERSDRLKRGLVTSFETGRIETVTA